MKGIVFTEFIELVEAKFGFETADEIMTNSDLPSGGAYTAVGTYDHQEMVQLLAALNKKTNIPVSDLLFTFGEHLFTKFAEEYPQFFQGVNSCFDFLQSIENCIHVEVRKLYSDAELPHFECEQNNGSLTMIYRSERGLGDFAHGLIHGCINHFNEKIAVVKLDMGEKPGSYVRFELTKI